MLMLPEYKKVYEGISGKYNFTMNKELFLICLKTSENQLIAFSVTAKPLVYLNAEIFKDFYQTGIIPKLKHEKFVPFEMGELTLKGNITINFGKYSGNSGIHCRNAQGVEVVPPGKHLGNSISEMATKLKDFVNSPQFRNAKTEAEAEKYWGS